MEKDFTKSENGQRTHDWYAERVGVPSASNLGAFLDTLKNGQPSARNREYRKQLAFERRFNTRFEKFSTKAMSEGIFYEDFARRLYSEEAKVEVQEETSYISDYFIATPDGAIGQAGLLECKVVGDSTFIDIIENGVPKDHYLQMQGQLMATGREWVDYIAVNIKTRAYIIIRVERDSETIQMIYDKLHEPLDLPDLPAEQVKRFTAETLDEWLEPQQEITIIKDLGF